MEKASSNIIRVIVAFLPLSAVVSQFKKNMASFKTPCANFAIQSCDSGANMTRFLVSLRQVMAPSLESRMLFAIGTMEVASCSPVPKTLLNHLILRYCPQNKGTLTILAPHKFDISSFGTALATPWSSWRLYNSESATW